MRFQQNRMGVLEVEAIARFYGCIWGALHYL